MDRWYADMNDREELSKSNSYFDGGLLELILINLFGALMTILSLGILYPWSLCLRYKWKIEHTVVEGMRMSFHGKAISLFGHWMLWLLLTILTAGIYLFWVNIRLEDWKVHHTRIG